MSEENKLIKLKIITPERVLFEDEVEKYIVKSNGEVGDFEIMYNHLPMTATIGIGKIMIYMPGGEVRQATLFGGFALVEKNSSTILSEVAEWPEDIDLKRAEEAKARAEENLKSTNMDYARARAALMRAVQRINICHYNQN